MKAILEYYIYPQDSDTELPAILTTNVDLPFAPRERIYLRVGPRLFICQNIVYDVKESTFIITQTLTSHRAVAMKTYDALRAEGWTVKQNITVWHQTN